MAKSYSEQLGEWVQLRSQSARRDKNLVAFLALKDEVKEAVDQGWPIKTIWAHLVEQKRITFSYSTFLNFVNRKIRHARAPGVSIATPFGPRSPAPSPRPVQQEPRSDPRRVPDPAGGFTFNAAPNKEELI